MVTGNAEYFTPYPGTGLDVSLLASLLASMLEALQKTIPILRASVRRQVVLADTDIFASPLTPTQQGATFRVTVVLHTAGGLSCVLSGAAVSDVCPLNSGANLEAQCLYAFDVPVTESNFFNMRCDSDNFVVLLTVHEIGVG